ncbi:MAG: NAD(P)/FAD-dependent oxidoreductase, partial [Flavitalea sp.]
TGVELAGMLAELGANIARKEYPEIPDYGTHIYLVDAGPVLLSPMSKTAQEEATKVLKKLGVHIILNVAVKDYVDGKVMMADGNTIETCTLIWASGVIAREVPGLPAESIGRGRRVLVDEYNRVHNFTNIFALGDQCLQTSDPKFPNGHPQVAQVAIQQGVLLAKNLKNMVSNADIKPFVYNDKGSMAIISKYNAVADLPKFSIKGFVAWFIWLFIHVIPLIGFRSKVELAFNWFFSFITNDPTLRLIIRPDANKQQRSERPG